MHRIGDEHLIVAVVGVVNEQCGRPKAVAVVNRAFYVNSLIPLVNDVLDLIEQVVQQANVDLRPAEFRRSVPKI